MIHHTKSSWRPAKHPTNPSHSRSGHGRKAAPDKTQRLEKSLRAAGATLTLDKTDGISAWLLRDLYGSSWMLKSRDYHDALREAHQILNLATL